MTGLPRDLPPRPAAPSVVVAGDASGRRDPPQDPRCRSFAGRKTFLAEMRRRGLAVAADAGQFAIFGNREPLRRLA